MLEMKTFGNLTWAYAGGGGGLMGSNDPPSPMRGHLHHWNSRTSNLHTCTLSTIALTQYRCHSRQ